ncbi:protein PELOTA 1-like [Vicia villosa]|uniref:protein PELOTA 1-like n=1 Tax=Vicia villosa TaxID=3911 RepID=UPI00273B8C9C|nr:protein PELOTA 1-like [Vicia villosa]
MKLLEKDFALNQTGTVKIIAEEPDDVWLLYNLIATGDVVTAETTRKVHLESNKNTASRVKLTLHLKVTSRDFHKDSSTLRVHGRNLEPNQHVAAGSFHTLTLQRNKPFELRKKIWGPHAVEALSDATENENSSSSSEANLAVVVLQQHQAEIHLLGKGVTTRCSKIEASSRSHKKSSSSSSSNVFFRDVFAAFVKHVDFKVVKTVVIAGDSDRDSNDNTSISPTIFRRFLLSEARRLRMRWIEENKSRIVVVGSRCNTNNKKGDYDFDLREVFNDVAVMNLIKDSNLGLEIRVFKELWDMVCNNSDRVCYGPKHVESAHEMKAIETLLISDDLYRNEEIDMRRKYVGLVKSVKEGGGKALVYSSMHVSTPQLDQLTGVAAILRFPLPGLQDMDDDDDHV